MSENAVNSQVTDSVSTANAQVIGNGPALSFSLLDPLTAETTGLLLSNAVAGQQQSQITGNASLSAVCAKMLSVPPPSNQAPVTVEAPRPVSPLSDPNTGTGGLRRHYSQAQSAIESLNAALKRAQSQEQNARTLLGQLAGGGNSAN